MLALPERYLIQKSALLKLGQRVSAEQFTLFYFDIFSEWDYQVELPEDTSISYIQPSSSKR
jgi:hypothetical protein